MFTSNHHTHTDTHIHMPIKSHIDMRASKFAWAQTSTNLRNFLTYIMCITMHAHWSCQTCIRMHTNTYRRTHTQTHTHTHVQTHTHAYTHIHKHTHTHTHKTSTCSSDSSASASRTMGFFGTTKKCTGAWGLISLKAIHCNRTVHSLCPGAVIGCKNHAHVH